MLKWRVMQNSVNKGMAVGKRHYLNKGAQLFWVFTWILSFPIMVIFINTEMSIPMLCSVVYNVFSVFMLYLCPITSNKKSVSIIGFTDDVVYFKYKGHTYNYEYKLTDDYQIDPGGFEIMLDSDGELVNTWTGMRLFNISYAQIQREGGYKESRLKHGQIYGSTKASWNY